MITVEEVAWYFDGAEIAIPTIFQVKKRRPETGHRSSPHISAALPSVANLEIKAAA
ncbi:MAG TPA: hypothetical protein VKV39_06705 [Candidatus Sulfotelmatobacter sp.]|nr:hypothetical protein [Candidatus Sulfotelmatobacter sp.]